MRRCLAVLVGLVLVALTSATPVSASGAAVRSPFTDVSTSHVFFEPMAWMAREKISTGYANGDGVCEWERDGAVRAVGAGAA